MRTNDKQKREKYLIFQRVKANLKNDIFFAQIPFGRNPALDMYKTDGVTLEPFPATPILSNAYETHIS